MRFRQTRSGLRRNLRLNFLLGNLWISSLIILAIPGFIATAAAQRPLSSVGRSSDLSLRIVYDNDHPVASPVSVQLLTAGGTPVQDTMSNDRGEVMFKSVPSGEYQVRISGIGVKDTVMELNA